VHLFNCRIIAGKIYIEAAGMPQIVILKAQKILKKLEKNHSSEVLSIKP
jgi:hypothetical protein